jgi:hypothetical protein
VGKGRKGLPKQGQNGRPNANTYAEPWIQTVREECLSHLLILNEKHLRQDVGYEAQNDLQVGENQGRLFI